MYKYRSSSTSRGLFLHRGVLSSAPLAPPCVTGTYKKRIPMCVSETNINASTSFESRQESWPHHICKRHVCTAARSLRTPRVGWTTPTCCWWNIVEGTQNFAYHPLPFSHSPGNSCGTSQMLYANPWMRTLVPPHKFFDTLRAEHRVSP